MDFTVEFRRIPRQLEFHVFRGTEGSARHLALSGYSAPRVKCRVSQTKDSSGAIGNMWHHVIEGKSK